MTPSQQPQSTLKRALKKLPEPQNRPKPSKKKSPLGCCQIPLTSVSSKSHTKPHTHPLYKNVRQAGYSGIPQYTSYICGNRRIIPLCPWRFKAYSFGTAPSQTLTPERFTCYSFRQFHGSKKHAGCSRREIE